MYHRIDRLWLFRLSALAFIALVTPAAAVYLRGVLGFFLILGLAIVAGTVEGSIFWAIATLHDALKKERFLLFIFLLYLTGLFFNLYYYSQLTETWRLMMSPVAFLGGICFFLLFLRHDSCNQQFQIWLLFALGAQSLYTIRALLTDFNVMREMVAQSQTGWVYGDQSGFALFSMLIPVFLGTAWRQSGILRLILLCCCFLLLASTVISTFATPLGLLLIEIGIIVILASFIRLIPLKTTLLVCILAIGVGVLIFLLTQDNPLLAPAYLRLANVTADPTSGGYSGQAADEGSRWLLAKISIESFLDAPLFGKTAGAISLSRYVGGHSSIFDALGGYGLLGGGGALCLLIFLLLQKAVKRFISGMDWESLLALASVISLVVGGIVNPYWTGWQPAYVLMIARPLLKREEHF